MWPRCTRRGHRHYYDCSHAVAMTIIIIIIIVVIICIMIIRYMSFSHAVRAPLGQAAGKIWLRISISTLRQTSAIVFAGSSYVFYLNVEVTIRKRLCKLSHGRVLVSSVPSRAVPSRAAREQAGVMSRRTTAAQAACGGPSASTPCPRRAVHARAQVHSELILPHLLLPAWSRVGLARGIVIIIIIIIVIITIHYYHYYFYYASSYLGRAGTGWSGQGVCTGWAEGTELA